MSGARTLRQVLNDPLGEPVPDEFLKLLAELPSFSDGSSGAGGYTEAGPTSLGSDILHCGDGSLSIPDALDGEPLASHGLAHRQGCTAAPPAKHSTPSNRGGSA